MAISADRARPAKAAAGQGEGWPQQVQTTAADHKTLRWEVGDLLSQWEMVQTEVEQGETGLSAYSIPSRPR